MPLHEAARRTDVKMLKLLLTQSKHELVGCSGVQHDFPQIKMPTDHTSATSKNSVHALLQKLPVTLLDGAGQTPLSLALCSSSSAAAVLLLDAGLQVLQPVKDLGDSGPNTVTHALLIAAKVRTLQPLLIGRHDPDWSQVAGCTCAHKQILSLAQRLATSNPAPLTSCGRRADSHCCCMLWSCNERRDQAS